jgi:hypothetical protein
MMDGKNLQEHKIIRRGEAYLTPMKTAHIEEFLDCIHEFNAQEILDAGYFSTLDCLRIMYSSSEAYVCRNKSGEIVFVGGLWFGDESPQMFCLFSNNLDKNTFLTAKMSKAMLGMFEGLHPKLTMKVSSRFEHMLSWAMWLGFEPCSITDDELQVEFVRCISNLNSVTHKALRPVVH